MNDPFKKMAGGKIPMKKIYRTGCCLLLAGASVLASGCGESEKLIPNGIYESEKIHGYTVQMTIEDDGQFVEYIDNRPVQSGSYTKEEETYVFEGDQTTFEVSLTEEETLEFSIPSIDNSNAIILEKTGNDPDAFEEETQGISNYRTLLTE